MQDTVIYEMHVRGFTKSPTSGVEHPGHVPGRDREDPVPPGARRDRGRAAAGLRVRRATRCSGTNPLDRPARCVNYWGYSPISFFAPHERLLRRARRGLARPRVPRHGQGAAQGRHRGHPRRRLQPHRRGQPRGPDDQLQGPRQQHLLPPRARRPAVLHELLGLREHVQLQPSRSSRSSSSSACYYWVREMHVDGFRFDEGSILSPRRRTARRWTYPPVLWHIELADDAGRHEDHRRGVGRRRPLPGRLLPGLPLGRVERPLPRRHPALRQGRPRARRRRSRRGSPAAPTSTRPTAQLPINSINFITAHDGFTLNDLVSYNDKHNEANGEGNRDGTDDNLSWNCGVEGDDRRPGDRGAPRPPGHELRDDPDALAGRADVRHGRRGRAGRSAATTTPTARTTRSPGSTGRASRRTRDLFRFFKRADRASAGATPSLRRRAFFTGERQRARPRRHPLARPRARPARVGRPRLARPRLHARRATAAARAATST